MSNTTASEAGLLDLWKEAQAEIKAGRSLPSTMSAGQVQAGALVQIYGTAALALETITGRKSNSPSIWRVVCGYLRDAIATGTSAD